MGFLFGASDNSQFCLNFFGTFSVSPLASFTLHQQIHRYHIFRSRASMSSVTAPAAGDQLLSAARRASLTLMVFSLSSILMQQRQRDQEMTRIPFLGA